MSSKFASAKLSRSAFLKKANADNPSSPGTKSRWAFLAKLPRTHRQGSAKQGNANDPWTVGQPFAEEEEEAKEPERMVEDLSWGEEAKMPELSRTNESTQGDGGSLWNQDQNIVGNEESVTVDDEQPFPTVNLDPATTNQPSRQATTQGRVSLQNDVVRRQSTVIAKRVSVLLGIQDLDLNLSDEDEEDASIK